MKPALALLWATLCVVCSLGALGTLGCAADEPEDAPIDGVGGGAPLKAQAPPPPARGKQLHVGPFHVPAGEEIHRCTVVNLPDTMLVEAVEAFAGENVHHFSIDATIYPITDGVYECNDVFDLAVMENSLTVFSTTKPHDRIAFGKGIAGKLPRGFFTLILSYHYLNSTDQPQDVEGYFNVETTSADQVDMLINGAVGNTRDFVVEPHSKGSFTKRCTTDRPIDVLALTSHAHAHLERFEISLIQGGKRPAQPHHVATDGLTPEMTVFTDGPIHLEPGDAMEWTCAFDNPSDTPITEGERTDQEMCMAVAIYKPDQGFLACNVREETEKAFKQLAPPSTIDEE